MPDRFSLPKVCRAILCVSVSFLVIGLLAGAPANAGRRPARSSFTVSVDDSPEGCTLDPGRGLIHGGVVRMTYTGVNRPLLRKPDGSVVRFSDTNKVVNLPNAAYEVFTAENNDPDGRILKTKTVGIDCPLPVNTAPDRFTVAVAMPRPDDPPVSVAVADVLAAATDFDGDPLSVVGMGPNYVPNMLSTDDGGTPNDFNDDVITLDTDRSVECGTDITANYVISDGRGGVTSYGTLRFENPFGPYWLCGNPW